MLQTILTVIYAVLIFSLIIFVHELGHFAVAKFFGVYVAEFAVGMGPALWKKQKGETLYAIRAIPMGGYCKMEEDEESEDPRAFVNQKKLPRFLILAAGSIMNLILGLVVMTVFVGTYMEPANFYTTSIESVISNMPAAQAGVMAGDQIVKTKGSKVNIRPDFDKFAAGGGPIDLTIKRGGKLQEITVTPKSYLINEAGEILGEGTGENARLMIGITFATEPKNIGTVIKQGYYRSIILGTAIIDSVKDLFTGRVPASQLSGPVGIVGVISDAAKIGLENILYLLALITINLGIFNLLPLPALDGGRIFFIVIEAVIRRPIPPKYEGLVHAAGFVLLILLMLYATGNDLFRLFRGM